MSLVVKLGGSVLAPDFTNSRFSEFAKIILQLNDKIDDKVFVVTGGGALARQYIGVAERLNASHAVRDLLGIGVSQLNAQLLIAAVGEQAYPEPPRNYEQALHAGTLASIIIMGGVVPGQTTDAVAAILSEYTNARCLIRVTTVDGVYTSDPRTNPDAKLLSRLTHDELVEVVMHQEITAGSNNVFDSMGAKILQRSKIPMTIVNGKEPSNILRAANGEQVGSRVE